ncbi:unnamed protein product [Pleuronectes platessa]|uniref:Uncharacterized protein n=1 Tax=Pleuronectes platessa TaxID=8262 RepID=A0A9N7TWT6_PLEPL|nr:unnamed protein product [Pleuronectes platessa]
MTRRDKKRATFSFRIEPFPPHHTLFHVHHKPNIIHTTWVFCSLLRAVIGSGPRQILAVGGASRMMLSNQGNQEIKGGNQFKSDWFLNVSSQQDTKARVADSPTSAPIKPVSAPIKQSLHQSNQSLHQSNQCLHQSNQSLHQSNQCLHQSNQSLHQSNQSLHQSNQSLHQSTSLCTNPTSLCTNPTSLCTNPTSLCTNPTSLCTNQTNLCTNPTSLCTNPTSHVLSNRKPHLHMCCYILRLFTQLLYKELLDTTMIER